MTDKQKTWFVHIMQIGIACGLSHPFECLENWLMHMTPMIPLDEVNEKEEMALESFVEFYKGTASAPEEEERLKNLTVEQMLTMMSEWYARKAYERSPRSSTE